MEGQMRIKQASVLIVGVGGLGAAAATYIVGAGVGHVGIADPDVVSLSNLQRQTLYTEGQVGRPKTECARKRLESMSTSTRFSLYPEGLTAENAMSIVAGYDLLIDCTDNFTTRYLIDDVCEAVGKPWVHGAIGEFSGQVTVFNHLAHRHYRELYPSREELCNQRCPVSGVLGAVPGVVGSLQASEALKIIAGFGETLEGRLFMIDMLTMNTCLIEF